MYIMLFANDDFDIQVKIYIGWFYLGFNSISLAVIFKTLVSNLIFKTIPGFMTKYQEFKKSYKIKKFKKKILRTKKQIADADPLNKLK